MRRITLFLCTFALLGAGAAIPLTTIGCHGNNAGTADMTLPPDLGPNGYLQPKPECQPGTLAIKPLHGDRQMVISSLKIADFNEGFDFNGDGKVDNKLAPLGALANSSITDAFKFQKNIIVPIELFGYNGMDTDCTKFAFYLGRYTEDRDGDGSITSWEANRSDCDDTNPAIHPGVKEDLTNRMDDDCDGYADNATPGVAPTDAMDLDKDGYSPAQGDCDDRADNPLAKVRWRDRAGMKAAMDICGDGIDQNCDGIPDNDPTCDPFTDNKVPVHVQALSFGGAPFPATDGGTLDPMDRPPLITFADGNVKGGVLNAGPDLFKLSIPFDKSVDVTLTLNGARIRMVLTDKPLGTYVTGEPFDDKLPRGLLGGVLEAISLAQIHIAAGGVLKKEQSLLDGVFVGPAGAVLGLDSDADGHYLPDIDVDGDGLETFWQEHKPTAGDGGSGLQIIDTCKDGDGTIIHNGDNGVAYCPMAKDAKGNYRFVDGLSMALKFTAVPVKLSDVVPK